MTKRRRKECGKSFPRYRFVALSRARPGHQIPKVTGWYRIHVGLYRDDARRVEPATCSRASSPANRSPSICEAPREGTGHVAEAYWKAADLTGKKIHHRATARAHAARGLAGWMGGITQLRLTPMTEQEVADAKKEIELPPVNQRMFAMLDTTDEIFWNGTAETEDDIRAMVYRHQRSGLRPRLLALLRHVSGQFASPCPRPRRALSRRRTTRRG